MPLAPHPNQRPWWEPPASTPTATAPRFRAVAYYRHSAQDRQENSVAIQQELVRKWADDNGVEIIHEFADRGKSGLTAEGRDGFNDLMSNWVKQRTDFQFVLCLDVSRWGRFQDIDLSATYSAECKRHNKQVVYTTLGMPRPDDPLYPVYVQFERFRAAQYSKELSVKVFHGCVKIAQQGYWPGGKPPYGFARLLLDESRKPLHVLAPRQRKSIQNQRVTLTPGNCDQVAIIKRIFEEFTREQRTIEDIASSLNQDGVPSAGNRKWNSAKVRRLLRNVMYAGTLVYNKTTQKLMTPTRRNPSDQWIRTAGAFEPIVDPAIFEQAQFLFAQEALRYSPEVMLSHLKRLHEMFGFVRPSLLRADDQAPSSSTFAKHFTSLDAAYQHVFRESLQDVSDEVESRIRQHVDQVEVYDDFLLVNRKFTVRIQPSVPVSFGYDQYWYFRPDYRGTVDITLGVLVSAADGPKIIGYLMLPRLMIRRYGVRLFASSEANLDMHGYTDLDLILQLARS